MHIKEIKESLLNCFHDSYISSISIDYLKREIIFSINIFEGDPDADTEEDREKTRDAILTIKKFHYFFCEPPDPRYDISKRKAIWMVNLCVDSDDWELPDTLPNNIPSNSFKCGGFISDWNSFIYFAGEDAEIVWTDDKKI